MTNLYSALIITGQVDEDGSDNPFQWAQIISKNPVDAEGNSVQNPGSFMLYGLRGVPQGEVLNVTLMPRGVAGLYNVIAADKVAEILKYLGLKASDLKEPPCVEQIVNQAPGAREAARQRRTDRRQARRGSTAVMQEGADQQVVEQQPA